MTHQSLRSATIICLVSGLLLSACSEASRDTPGEDLSRPAGGPSPSPSSEIDTAAVDAVVTNLMEEQRVPGVALAIVERGEVLLSKGYGMANLELEVPVGPKTMFQSGSVGKMFTAAGLMALVEDGLIELEAPIRTYLPQGPRAWDDIQVRHLLTHTSGIPDYTSDDFDYTSDYHAGGSRPHGRRARARVPRRGTVELLEHRLRPAGDHHRSRRRQSRTGSCCASASGTRRHAGHAGELRHRSGASPLRRLHGRGGRSYHNQGGWRRRSTRPPTALCS